MTRAERGYRRLLIVLPASFREEAEAELLDVFRVAHARAASLPLTGRLWFWILLLMDLLFTAAAEWRALWRGPEHALKQSRKHEVDVVKHIGWGIRHLLRRPGRAAVSAVALGLGIATTVVGLVLVRGVLLSPLPFEESEQLVRLHEVDEQGRIFSPSFPNIQDWRTHGGRIFESVGAVEGGDQRPVIWDGQAQRLAVGGYTRGLLQALRVRPVAGRDFTDAENAPGGAPVLLVSWDVWQTRLNARPLEQLSVTIGPEQYAVIGVLPQDFRFFTEGETWGSADIFLPLERSDLGGRESHGFHTVARLHESLDPATAQPLMNALARQLREAHGEPTQAHTVAVTSVLDDVIGNVRDPLRMLVGAAILVLLIACLNVGGSLLAQGIGRDREFALRLAIGGRRRDLLAQLLAESTALALPGALLGALLAAGILQWLRQLQSQALPRLENVVIDATTLALTFGVALIAAIVAGMVPAVILSARDLGSRLRGSMGLTATRGTQRLWSGFIAAQTALTLVLLFGGALLMRSLLATMSVPLGFSADNVIAVSVSLPESRYSDASRRPLFYDALLERVRALPGVEAAGISTKLPHEVSDRTAHTSRAGDDLPPVFAAYRVVDPGYFATVGIPAMRGAAPGTTALGASDAFIDEALARHLAKSGEDVGALISSRFQETPARVVGTVGEVRDWTMDEGMPTVYVDYRTTERQDMLMEMHLLVRVRGDMDAVAAAVRAAVRDIDPMVPVAAAPLDTHLARLVADRRLILGLISGFAAIALCLAAVAMYAMVSFVVGRRRREIGIRVSLGAAPGQVIADTMRNGVLPAAAGLGVGLVGAVLLGSLLQSQLYGVAPRDPVSLIAATVLLALTALIASAIPARTAARVDPATVLRAE